MPREYPGRLRRFIAGLFVLAAGCASVSAQTRRALLVGIDEYIQPSQSGVHPLSERTRERLKSLRGRPGRKHLMNLDGAVNDVTRIGELLIGRFQFEKSNVILLTNKQATADNILHRLEAHLIESARPGDISLFYYAGHGSRIKNTLTQNRSGVDSTIIPADALLGVPDIRSKELARIYALAPARGVQLTVIQDSCFSGGGARGPTPRKTRVQAEDLQVSVAERLAAAPPENEGVLILSASQDYQPAQELRDSEMKEVHGAFSWALIHVLSTSPPDDRADRIFQRTRALMQSKVNDQEPAVLALKGRNERGLFGQTANGFGVGSAAVGYVDGEKQMIELNGGLAMSLHPGCELKRIVPSEPALIARVTEVNGPGLSNAVIEAPYKVTDVHAGDLFQLHKWAAPDQEALRVFIGSSLPMQSISEALRAFAPLRSGRDLEWISDPTVRTPTHILSWDGGKNKWRLNENSAGSPPVWLDAPAAGLVAKHLPVGGARPRLSVLVPIANEVAPSIQFGRGSVSVVDSPASADYMLLGRRVDNGRIEYAWAQPATTEEELQRQYEEAGKYGRPKPLPARPLRTDWLSTEPLGPALAEAALQLAKVVGWLDLHNPIPDDSFPYRLALRRVETKQIVTQGELRHGENYKLLLKRDGRTATPSAPRRVYIFVVDSYGEGKLVFPPANLENEFPARSEPGKSIPDEIEITKEEADVCVGPPFGIDNYFLLSTTQAIDEPQSVFNFAGVRTRAMRALQSPLENLISMRASGARGSLSGVPTDWSIERVSFRSVERPGSLCKGEAPK